MIDLGLRILSKLGNFKKVCEILATDETIQPATDNYFKEL